MELRSGEVAMNGPNRLTPQQEADESVLTCVGCPLSAVTLYIAEPCRHRPPSRQIGRCSDGRCWQVTEGDPEPKSGPV